MNDRFVGEAFESFYFKRCEFHGKNGFELLPKLGKEDKVKKFLKKN